MDFEQTKDMAMLYSISPELTCMCDQYSIHPCQQCVEEDETWVTKEGKKLQIKDMSTAHIKNCMRLIKGKMPNKYISFEYELKRRKIEDL